MRGKCRSSSGGGGRECRLVSLPVKRLQDISDNFRAAEAEDGSTRGGGEAAVAATDSIEDMGVEVGVSWSGGGGSMSSVELATAAGCGPEPVDGLRRMVPPSCWSVSKPFSVVDTETVEAESSLMQPLLLLALISDSLRCNSCI